MNAPIFNTDLIALLPQAQRDQVLEKHIAQTRKSFEQKIIFMLDMPAKTKTKNIADQLYKTLEALESAGHIKIIKPDDTISDLISFYKRLRFSFLTAKTYQLLSDKNFKEFEHTVFSLYFEPMSFITSDIIQDEPLLLLPSLIKEKFANQSPPLHHADGLLITQHQDRLLGFIFAELTTTPFSITAQNAIMPRIKQAAHEIEKSLPNTKLHTIGVLSHAANGTQSAREEIFLFGLIALVGVMGLFIFIFRSFKPLLITLATIGTSCLVGLIACLAIFGEIHLFVLVFGVSLVGISVDYSFHHFCEGFHPHHEWVSDQALKRILPGITFGLITSEIGFGGLLFAPFPGIKQIAVFSAAGLISAYLCVVFLYPTQTQNLKFPRINYALRLVQSFSNFWQSAGHFKKLAIISILLAIAGTGGLQLTIRDDIRLLQKPNAELLKAEARISEILQRNLASQFFLVEGQNNEELLMRQERLSISLSALEAENQLENHIALSHFIPSRAQQRRAKKLIRPVINDPNGSLDKIAAQIGLPSEMIRAYREDFAASENDFVLLSDWQQHRSSLAYRHLWPSHTERGVIGLVQLENIRNLSALNALAQEQPGVHFIDTISTYTRLFEQYRQQIIQLTSMSYIFVLLLLIVRYGARGGIAVMLSPVLAACVSIGAAGWLAEPLTLFHVMALLLILGIGVDYSIFFRETKGSNITTTLAVALSAITTILSFGLLAFSKTQAIHAFGLIVMIGIMIAFLTSPLGNWGKENGKIRNR